MNYIEIDFTKVKGYNKLLPKQQELFQEIYRIHNSIQGLEYKEDWIPVKIEWIKDNPDKFSHLKVIFKNGQWLHYTQRKQWY